MSCSYKECYYKHQYYDFKWILWRQNVIVNIDKNVSHLKLNVSFVNLKMDTFLLVLVFTGKKVV